jgi:sigma-54 dependent transcriptional regulator
MSQGRRLHAFSRDPASKQLLQHLERIAPSDASVLIVGESGTGKELLARHVHERSGRRGPFVAVNCGALTPALAESELFGHEAGSFTGATRQRIGWFEAADGGTLLLDEIGELPADLQVKILRVLQEREVTRVGSRRAHPVNVRLIAATHVDLAEAVSDGRFRADLYFRLNVARIAVAPLRERRADIVPLAEHFVSMHGARLRDNVPALAPETKEALLSHDWPGNIRELENVIQSALIAGTGTTLRPEDLRIPSARLASRNADPAPARSAARPGAAASLAHSPASGSPWSGSTNIAGMPGIGGSSGAPESSALDALAGVLDRLLESAPSHLLPRVEEFLVRGAWSRSRGNPTQAARLLGVPRNQMRTQLRRYGLIESGTPVTEDFLSAGAGSLHQAAG